MPPAKFSDSDILTDVVAITPMGDPNHPRREHRKINEAAACTKMTLVSPAVLVSSNSSTDSLT